VRSILILTLFSLIARPAIAQEVWPQSFVWADGAEHAFVVLYQDGRAAYSQRMKRPGVSDWYFAASQARWVWCDEEKHDSSVRCLHLFVEGYSDRRLVFRLDYWHESSKITEFDKGGVQRVLGRVVNASR
jgi:hypothetical protein